jgi:hypothetical protein
MQTKASVEPCNAIGFEDVPYRFNRIGRFGQGDTLAVGNGIFQLPPNLGVAGDQGWRTTGKLILALTSSKASGI